LKKSAYKRIALAMLTLIILFITVIPSYADTSVYKRGDSSAEIAEIQAALKKLGFFDEVCTGYFGEVTEGAVLKFQEKYNLGTDGIIGPITIGKLNELTGGHIAIPSRSSSAKKDTTKVNVRYKIKKGDTIWDIAGDYNVSVESILDYNGLNEKSILTIGDEIIIPNVVKVVKPALVQTVPPPSVQDSSELGNIYEHNKNIYVVKEEDTIESIAEDYGVSAESIKNENNFNNDTVIQIGQEIKIPEGTDQDVEEDTTEASDASGTKGEYLDWFKDVQYIYDKGDKATVTDVETGKSFNVRRLYGRNHADTEPLTPEDTKIMKSIYGGSWSWNRRPIILTIEDDEGVLKKIAASMNGMPHGGEDITDNGMNGHFCIHFRNSRTHSGSRSDPGHQKAVKIAAGLE